ncbi:MAG: tetratricopeptide repeat protein [Candidatus Promineifilaceae bacterium]|nr:tetratricopeptide repeat protein [Candidatus Promineifilaceae bacterium]
MAAFEQAAAAAPDNPEYHLNLARAYARAGRYDNAMRSLGDYLHVETDEELAARYERMFSSAFDHVEERLVAGSELLDLPVQLTGKAIQMWLEYRLTLGRERLVETRPAAWAAALVQAVNTANLSKMPRKQVAAVFEVSEQALAERFNALETTLDLIPADYRYFIGEENPLDKLVEAAKLLDQEDRAGNNDQTTV